MLIIFNQKLKCILIIVKDIHNNKEEILYLIYCLLKVIPEKIF